MQDGCVVVGVGVVDAFVVVVNVVAIAVVVVRIEASKRTCIRLFIVVRSTNLYKRILVLLY